MGFHVLEGDRVHTGAEAFVLLWSAMLGWRHLAVFARALRLVPIMELVYRWLARRRLRRRCSDEHCAVA